MSGVIRLGPGAQLWRRRRRSNSLGGAEGGGEQAEAPEKHSALLRETTLSPSFTLNHLLNPQISQSYRLGEDLLLETG